MSKMSELHYNLTSQIIKYEEDGLDEEQTIELFQQLIDTGMVWELQGHYGRTAMYMLDNGYCVGRMA